MQGKNANKVPLPSKRSSVTRTTAKDDEDEETGKTDKRMGRVGMDRAGSSLKFHVATLVSPMFHDMMTEVAKQLFKDSVSAASLSTSMKMIRGGETRELQPNVFQ